MAATGFTGGGLFFGVFMYLDYLPELVLLWAVYQLLFK